MVWDISRQFACKDRNGGAAARLGKVELDIQGVETEPGTTYRDFMVRWRLADGWKTRRPISISA